MDQSKTVLMDTPPVYSELLPKPKIPCLGGLKKLLCVVLVVVVLVIVLLGVLLMGLHLSQKHTETIFEMSLHDGANSKLRSSGGVATFHLDTGINTSASVVYDYSKMLICTRPRPGHACYITRMETEPVQSLQSFAENVLSKVSSNQSYMTIVLFPTGFGILRRNTETGREERLGIFSDITTIVFAYWFMLEVIIFCWVIVIGTHNVGSDTGRQNDPLKLVSDPSILGTTIRVLCGDLPVYWA